MPQKGKINIALVEKHPVLLQTLKLILESVSNFDVIYTSRDSVDFSHLSIDILIINEQAFLYTQKPIIQTNFNTICLSTEFKKRTVKNNIIFLNQACDLDELINTINYLAEKNATPE